MLSGLFLFGVELVLGKHLDAVSRDGCQQVVGGYEAVELDVGDVEELFDANSCEERSKAGVEALVLVLLIVAWHLIVVFQSDRKSTRLNSSHVASSYAVF